MEGERLRINYDSKPSGVKSHREKSKFLSSTFAQIAKRLTGALLPSPQDTRAIIRANVGNQKTIQR